MQTGPRVRLAERHPIRRACRPAPAARGGRACAVSRRLSSRYALQSHHTRVSLQAFGPTPLIGAAESSERSRVRGQRAEMAVQKIGGAPDHCGCNGVLPRCGASAFQSGTGVRMPAQHGRFGPECGVPGPPARSSRSAPQRPVIDVRAQAGEGQVGSAAIELEQCVEGWRPAAGTGRQAAGSSMSVWVTAIHRARCGSSPSSPCTIAMA